MIGSIWIVSPCCPPLVNVVWPHRSLLTLASQPCPLCPAFRSCLLLSATVFPITEQHFAFSRKLTGQTRLWPQVVNFQRHLIFLWSFNHHLWLMGIFTCEIITCYLNWLCTLSDYTAVCWVGSSMSLWLPSRAPCWTYVCCINWMLALSILPSSSPGYPARSFGVLWEGWSVWFPPWLRVKSGEIRIEGKLPKIT